MLCNTLSITNTSINVVKLPIMKHINNIVDVIFIYYLFSCPFFGVSKEDVAVPLGLFHRSGYKTHVCIALSLNV